MDSTLFRLLLITVVSLGFADAARCATPLPPAPLEAQDAISVFNCEFNESWDVNYDGWPDGWRRAEGPEFPRYVKAELVEDAQVPARRALRVQLDGARVKLLSPPMRVAARFSYSVRVQLKMEGISQSSVDLAIDFLDRHGERLQTASHEKITKTDGWQTFELMSVRPISSRTDRAIVRIETNQGERGDIHGLLSIGAVKVVRLPSMDVTTNSPFNVYTDPRDVIVTCSLSGIGEQDPTIRFKLLDATSNELDALVGVRDLDGKPIVGGSGTRDATGKLIHEESRRASDIIHGSNVHRVGYEGTAQWHPPLEAYGYGFYHVLVEMIGKRSGKLEDWRTITLAIVPPQEKTTLGEFGWTLPTADKPLSFDTLQELLPHTGVSWIKTPVWFDQDHPTRGEEVLRFVEQLSSKDIETIGILDEPTAGEHRAVGEPVESDIASVLADDPSVWQPHFDHLMTRLSLRIRWWQFGFDHDTSFVGYDGIVEKINNIRQQLYRFGQDVQVGIGWRWDIAPITDPISWDFEQYSSSPPLNAKQLNEKLTDPVRSKAKRWVLINPTIDESQYANDRERLNARIREMIHQIVVAKWRGVQGIFVANPFSADPKTGIGGLMCTNGTPGDLLLPWRTTATHLSNAQHVGSLSLPNGSRNLIFEQDGEHLMLVWNDRPTTEALYLGDNVRLVNVWGQNVEPQQLEVEPGFVRQVIPVGRLPTFVLGVNGSVARWRMAVRLDRDRVPSVFGEDHSNALVARNPFRQGVGGSLQFFVPDQHDQLELGTNTNLIKRRPSKEWRVSPADGQFSASPGGEIHHPFAIRLNNATFGPQPVRIDFDLEADQRYRFSVWRNMQVGLGEVEINVRTHLDENGRLVIQQRMVHHTDERLDFKCHLYAGSRRRKRVHVFQLGPEGDEKTYTYSNGEQLLGQPIRLRVEEVDGSRVIVHNFFAEP